MNVTCVKEVLEKQLAKNTLMRLYLECEIELAEDRLKDAQLKHDKESDYHARSSLTRLEIMLQDIKYSDSDIANILNDRDFRNIY